MQKYLDKVLELCEEGTSILSEYINSRTKLKLSCKNNHYRYFSHNEITSRKRGLQCQECKGFIGKKKTDALVKQEFLQANYELLESYKGANILHKAKHLLCGSELMLQPSRIAKHIQDKTYINCPVCDPKPQQRTTESLSKELKGLILKSEFTKVKSNILVQNIICGHEYEINLANYLYSNTGRACPVCKDTIKTRFFSKLENLQLQEDYKTTQIPIKVKNTLCNHEYSVIPLNLVHNNSGLVCRICNPQSLLEVEVLSFLQKIYTGKIIQHARILLGKEIDIFLPDSNIGFELNGIYFHQEDKLGTYYHQNKTNTANSLGIRLIQINEDEWINKQNIVKSRIASIFGHNLSIPARKTILKPILFPEAFLNENHIQGAGSITPINYGLFYYDELVAVMTFKKPRFSNEDFELVRYCSLTGTTVIGGASKLFKYFITQYKPTSLVTYSDRRWNTGNLYKVLGFTLSHISEPNYRYYKRLDSLSRYQCQKHLLKDRFPEYYQPHLSEKEIMQLAGYIKVTDAGNDVYKCKL